MNINALFPEFLKKILSEFKLEELEGKEFPLSGTFAFADISGFTKLSEELMKLGTEGSEILSNILNFYYENIIKIIKKYKGDVLGFAGDALSIYFEKDYEAINSSLEIQDFFKKKGKIETKIGFTDISIKIGLAEEDAIFYILKSNDFINFVFEGKGINKTAEAEHLSSPGEIVFIKNNNFLKIKDKIPVKIEEKTEEKVDENHLYNLLPNSLKDFLKEGREEFLNEHKNCVILFINLEKANLKEIYKKTSYILKKYSGYFLKVDCGDKGDKFIILFGIPYQISEPINNAFDFLLEFKELAKIEGFKFKAGVNYSKIFAGILGSKQRCEYTVLGDGVNLSARLMQISGENEITTLKELMQKTSENYLFNQEPPVQFKGKTGLFDLYKLIEKRTYKPLITSFYGRKKELANLFENFNDNSSFCIYPKLNASFEEISLKDSNYKQKRCKTIISFLPTKS